MKSELHRENEVLLPVACLTTFSINKNARFEARSEFMSEIDRRTNERK